MKRVRIVLLGGFLGAGKTTAIARLAKHYTSAGRRVAVVTNDQAFGLVDSAALRSEGFAVGEVPGACFCCKFDDLVETVGHLSETEHPDIILAEPVGSCTDLVATVIEPLRQFYGDAYETAPFGVLLKPEQGTQILNGDSGDYDSELSNDPEFPFSAEAAYIFRKQLEEADFIAINKSDRLTSNQIRGLSAAAELRFPGKDVFAVSARTGAGFDLLLERLAGTVTRHTDLAIDYDTYATGEAELGWLNCDVVLTAQSDSAPFAIDAVTIELVERIAEALKAHGAEPAHVKVLAQAGDATAMANLVASSAAAELSLAAESHADHARLIVNARVAVSPNSLSAIVQEQVAMLAAAHGICCELGQVQSFRPGRPVPIHRLPVA
jgi:G3E family GTPase